MSYSRVLSPGPDVTRWDPTMGPVTTLGSYLAVTPAFYEVGMPDGPFESGAPGWASAPVLNWGVNPNQAGPRRLAVNGLGQALDCKCRNTSKGQDCTCRPPPPPPPRPPFWHALPHWNWPGRVQPTRSPWGSGRRAYDVPRRAICTECRGTRVASDPFNLQGLGALGSAQWQAIPWYCWKTASGAPNTAFVNCKDRAIAEGMARLCGGLTGEVKKQCESGVSSAQRIQWQMEACNKHCTPRTSGGGGGGGGYTPSPSSPSPADDPGVASSSWRDYLPQVNTTTLVVAGLVAVAGAVYAQQKGYI